MTKFKVGDKVTLYGEVVEVSNTDVRHGLSVLLDGRDDRENGDEYPVYVNESEIAYVKKRSRYRRHLPRSGCDCGFAGYANKYRRVPRRRCKSHGEVIVRPCRSPRRRAQETWG